MISYTPAVTRYTWRADGHQFNRVRSETVTSICHKTLAHYWASVGDAGPAISQRLTTFRICWTDLPTTLTPSADVTMIALSIVFWLKATFHSDLWTSS